MACHASTLVRIASRSLPIPANCGAVESGGAALPHQANVSLFHPVYRLVD